MGIKTELVAYPITVQLTQSIIRPLLSVALSVGLFCEGVQFLKAFTLCDLDNFDVIFENTFLDADKINIFHNKGELKIRAKIGSKLVNLNLDYNYALAKVGITLVVLVSKFRAT